MPYAQHCINDSKPSHFGHLMHGINHLTYSSVKTYISYMMTISKLLSSRSLLFKFTSYLLLFYCLNFLKLQWLILASAKEVPVKVGVVLDMENMEGKVRLSCMNMALSDFYAAHSEFKTRIILHVRDTKDHDVVMAAAAVVDLIKNDKVAAIIGPETSKETQFVINLGEKAQVPIVSYSASSPFLSPLQNRYFIRATQDDSSQVQPLSAFIQAFGWREAVPIYVDDEFGGGIIPFLADALQEVGTSIPYRSVIPSSASDDQILAELYKLKSLSTRVFIVHMPASLGSRLFLKVEQLGMMGQDYVWIITNAIANKLNNVDPRVIRSMQGVVGVKTYVPETQELESFAVRWKAKFQQENPTLVNARLDVYGLWAYDAATLLARAAEEVGITNFTFQRPDTTVNFSTDVSDLGVSNSGQPLSLAILGLKFKGLSGNFFLVDGQLQSSTFQLINVWGSGGKGIGYWTPTNGLVKDITQASTSKYSTSKVNLESVRWPGNPASFPRGWVSSPNGSKLRIGVPIKDGFRQFVTVTVDPATNTTKVTGFCIDVFDAVMKKLPYSVLYEYVPYTETEGEPTYSYDNLIYQVYRKNLDAAVGDVTIRANRSLYVDFALPFTDSGVLMVVPMKNNKEIRAWLFVKPLTWELWITTFCSFIFIAFVIWVLEHPINEDFRGPPTHQAGTSLYYSFSTMVFAHSFGVFSNLTRFVVIIWVFVVLILVQSYTANLASLLTVQQLQPAFTDVKELQRGNYNVGYQEGSFVKELLLQMNFKDSKLKPFNSTEGLDELLTLGTAKGGIEAAFDEIQYLKLFLAQYCSKYTTVPPTYKTDGFGFAFPIGSPVVSDVSRTVLAVTEGDEMTGLENKWLKTNNCPDSSTLFSSSSLGLDSFWGLFTIAGTAALFALIKTLVAFLREHKHVLFDRSASVWTRIKTLSRIYDQKDLSSHTFRKSQPQDPSPAGTTTNTPYPQSPSSYVDNSERGFSKYEGQSTPSQENADPTSSTLAPDQEGAADDKHVQIQGTK